MDITFIYSVTGELIIFDRNNHSNIMNRRGHTFLAEREITLDNTEKVNISELIKVDYDEFNSFVAEFRRNTNVQSAAHLIVTLSVEGSSEQSENSGSVNVNRSISITVPLGEPTIQLSTSYIPTYQSPNIEITTNETAVNTAFKILSIISAVLGSVLIGWIVVLNTKIQKKLPIYERFINELKNDYDADISELNNLIDTIYEEKYEYLDVKSFKDLYEEVRKSNNKQIYWNEAEVHAKGKKVPNRTSWFFIKGADKTITRFIVDEKKLTEDYESDKNILKKYRG